MPRVLLLYLGLCNLYVNLFWAWGTQSHTLQWVFWNAFKALLMFTKYTQTHSNFYISMTAKTKFPLVLTQTSLWHLNVSLAAETVCQRLTSVFGLQTKWTRILRTGGLCQAAICLAKAPWLAIRPSLSVLVIGSAQTIWFICNNSSTFKTIYYIDTKTGFKWADNALTNT